MFNKEIREKRLYEEYKGSRYFLDEYINDTWQDGWKRGVKSGLDVAKDAIIYFVVVYVSAFCLIGILALIINNFFSIYPLLGKILPIATVFYILIAPKYVTNYAINRRGWYLDEE